MTVLQFKGIGVLYMGMCTWEVIKPGLANELLFKTVSLRVYMNAVIVL